MHPRFRRTAVAAFVALLGSALWVAAQHQHGQEHGQPAGQTVSVKGQVVDLSCYLSGSSCNLKCAQACAKKGLPMGLLAAEGKLYLLIEDHSRAEAYQQAIGHAGHTVTVKGQVFEKGGLRALQVQAVSG